jgi:hypothetical protein
MLMVNLSNAETCALLMLGYYGLSLFYGWIISAAMRPESAQ